MDSLVTLRRSQTLGLDWALGTGHLCRWSAFTPRDRSPVLEIGKMVANAEFRSTLSGNARPRAVSGRVLNFVKQAGRFRLRSELQGWGAHWLGEHVLCAGSRCSACAAGNPARMFWFGMFDLAIAAGSSQGLCRFTASDFGVLRSAAESKCGVIDCGATFSIARPVERKPIVAIWERFQEGLARVEGSHLTEEVLALHGIRCVTPLENAPLDAMIGIIAGRMDERLATRRRAVS